MAKIDIELPNDILSELSNLEIQTDTMMSEMVEAPAQMVLETIRGNMKKSFKTDRSLIQGLKLSRIYKTPSDDGINIKVILDGYSDTKTKQYPNGIPIPLIANAREFGTSSGEAKKPFFRVAFKKKQIEAKMMEVQNKYLPKEWSYE